MKLFIFLSALMFMTFSESVPVVSQPLRPTTPAPVSGKLVERYIDDITRTLSIDHENALSLIKKQQDISISKKKKIDILNNEFQNLKSQLTNITATYNEYNNQRNGALKDYNAFMVNFKKVESLIMKNKIDYENEINFLKSIKNYIKKVQTAKC